MLEAEKFTLQGDAQINEATPATAIPRSTEAGTFVHASERPGQLADGKNGWLRLVDDDGKPVPLTRTACPEQGQ